MSYGYVDTEEFRNIMLSLENSLGRIADATEKRENVKKEEAKTSGDCVYVLTIQNSDAEADVADGYNLFVFSNYEDALQKMYEGWAETLYNCFDVESPEKYSTEAVKT